ncbi:Gti1/Pac2 family-domain-containing protein [Crucibulum laeve]|uniref:Gti1/Pac2 family-domain-containing protein n=1 Tax=Crucibulum laeve TaxID=68775 RepID=A0A5C3MFY9_9AGAR|nr:Gti1/Pac2 family-domain-containing protein [Crucibulum laeve]
MMQRPTCTHLRVRSPSDAHVIFHAVSLNVLPIISRRLDTDERRAISSGCVFVWEERGPNAEATGLGIERWTDSIRWGPSRVRDEFLFYHEKDTVPADAETTSDSDTTMPSRSMPGHGTLRESLIKQTYSVFVDTPRGRRKWHLIAYFTQDTLDYLRTIDDFPELASLQVPPGKYKSARSSKSRPPRDPPEVMDRYSGTIPNYTMISRVTRPLLIVDTHTRPMLSNNSHRVAEILAPLTYLQNIPPPPRHPMDEKALMSFTSGLV